PLETLVGVAMESSRVVVTTGVEEIGRDLAGISPVQIVGTGQRSLVDMNHADHYSRFAGPPQPFPCGVNRTAVATDPAQPGRARVSLSDRVRGDQSEASLVSQKGVSPAVKEGHYVGVPLRLRKTGCQPIQIGATQAFPNLSTTHKRRVADDDIESTRPAAVDKTVHHSL